MVEEKIPYHVAIILDGNGRWAKERGLIRSLGHKAGFDNLNKLARYIFKRGVKVLSVFAFSTENFKRDQAEVDYLMNLFADNFKSYVNTLDNVKIVFSGIRGGKLPDKVIKAMNEIEEMTKDCDGYLFNICINFGGRSDIVQASRRIALDYAKGDIDLDDLTEEKFQEYLYNGIPDIDLLIRTSGEMRISNFLLYQAAYAEFYFPDTYFPSFDEDEFDKAILAYNHRDRRFGGINKNK